MATATMSAPKKGTKKKGKGVTEWDGEGPKPKTVMENRLTARDDEIEAAVAGTLKPRKDAKEIVDPKVYKLTDGKGRPAGRPLGKTTGLPILLAWCYIFQENERRGPKSKMTDDAITRWMKEEFPGRETPAFDHPQTCRHGYNLGRFTKNAVPKVPSFRYDENGQVATPRGGKPGKSEGKAKGGSKKGDAKASKKEPKKEAPASAKETVSA